MTLYIATSLFRSFCISFAFCILHFHFAFFIFHFSHFCIFAFFSEFYVRHFSTFDTVYKHSIKVLVMYCIAQLLNYGILEFWNFGISENFRNFGFLDFGFCILGAFGWLGGWVGGWPTHCAVRMSESDWMVLHVISMQRERRQRTLDMDTHPRSLAAQLLDLQFVSYMGMYWYYEWPLQI